MKEQEVTTRRRFFSFKDLLIRVRGMYSLAKQKMKIMFFESCALGLPEFFQVSEFKYRGKAAPNISKSHSQYREGSLRISSSKAYIEEDSSEFFQVPEPIWQIPSYIPHISSYFSHMSSYSLIFSTYFHQAYLYHRQLQQSLHWMSQTSNQW